MTIYSTTHQMGIDVNAVFFLDPVNALEYPAPPFQPGELAWGTDGSEWVYCQASLSIAAGAAVLISTTFTIIGGVAVGPGNWSVTPVGSIASGPAGTFQGDLVGVVGGSQGLMTVGAPSGSQSSSYFWVQRAGLVPNLNFAPAAGATGTVNSALHSTSTAAPANGAVATVASATSFAINGLFFVNATASVAGPNIAIANYPTVGSAA